MRVFQPKQSHPLECEVLGSSILVHFGVVFCQSTNSENSTFVPEIEFGDRRVEIKRDGENEVFSVNVLPFTGKGVVYLEIETSEDIYDSYLEKWRSAFYEKKPGQMATYMAENFSEQEVSDYFTSSYDSDLLSKQFSPLCPLSPRVVSVTLKFYEMLSTPLDRAEDLDFFNFIVDYKKNVAIAIIDDSLEKKVEQLISNDYFFSFPSVWKEESSNLFLK